MYTLVHYLFSTAQLCDLQHLGRATSQARGPVLVLCHCLPRRNSAACIDAAACRLLAHTYLVSLWVSVCHCGICQLNACLFSPLCSDLCGGFVRTSYSVFKPRVAWCLLPVLSVRDTQSGTHGMPAWVL